MHALSVLTMTVGFALAAAQSAAQTFTFDKDTPGSAPGGFSCGLTGRGKPGVWVVKADPNAPSPPNVLAQVDPDPTDYRFPVCTLDAISAADVDVSVRFKAVSGSVDRAAGLVWRFTDVNNYYIVRANANENNVTLYKVVDGKRTSIAPKGTAPSTYGRSTPVSSGQWHTLRVVAAGPLFQVYYDGQRIYDVEDATFKAAGKVGVWTKADSVTYFDDLQVSVK